MEIWGKLTFFYYFLPTFPSGNCDKSVFFNKRFWDILFITFSNSFLKSIIISLTIRVTKLCYFQIKYDSWLSDIKKILIWFIEQISFQLTFSKFSTNFCFTYLRNLLVDAGILKTLRHFWRFYLKCLKFYFNFVEKLFK